MWLCFIKVSKTSLALIANSFPLLGLFLFSISWLKYRNATPILNCGLKLLQQIGKSFYYFRWQTDALLYCPTGH
jgi:hypothetical protein